MAARISIPIKIGALKRLAVILSDLTDDRDEKEDAYFDLVVGGPNLQVQVLGASKRPLTRTRTLN